MGRPRLLLIACLLLLPDRAAATPFLSATSNVIDPGTPVQLGLFLDPNGERLGAYLLKFEPSPGLTVLGVQLVPVAGCDQLSSGPDETSGNFSLDGQCALTALEAGGLVAQITVQGTAGSLLQLDLTSNFTDFDTFLDAAIEAISPTGFPDLPPGTIAVIVPEPFTLGLIAAGLGALALGRRNLRISSA